MLIPNQFINLEYNPTTDVLLIKWPNMHDYTEPEIKYILHEIIETVKNYDIKNILTDTRQSVITMDSLAYAAVVNQLARDLMTTRLEKFARLTTKEKYREQIANDAAALVLGVIQVRSFDDPDEALEWLAAK